MYMCIVYRDCKYHPPPKRYSFLEKVGGGGGGEAF